MRPHEIDREIRSYWSVKPIGLLVVGVLLVIAGATGTGGFLTIVGFGLAVANLGCR